MPTKTDSDSDSQGPPPRVVSPEIFKQVYESPLSLPGEHRWVTKDEDVADHRETARNPQVEHRRPALGERRHAQWPQVRSGNELACRCLFGCKRRRTTKHYSLK